MISPFQFEDYRLYLKMVLAEKKLKKRISVGAVASRLNISHSYLSRVLSGQRNISATVASKFSHILDLTPEEESHFLRLIARGQIGEGEAVRLGLQRRLDIAKNSTLKVISPDAFVAIADWHYFAILSLTNTKGFRSDPRWIARRLGLDLKVTEEALQRLLQLGYLVLKNGRLKAVEDANLETTPGVASEAVRENHRQHLSLAAAAQSEVPFERREFVNCGIPMKVADVSVARKRIQTFFDRFIKDMEQNPGDEIFQLNIQFYQLTKDTESTPS
jgi:uncharacterized protein (TIGR02147 family)